MKSLLINKLAKRYTCHTSPDVATTVEQGLMQLSSGIYTEEERFVFELLQNAVDSFDEEGDKNLLVNLRIEGDYMIFMHNGTAFSERDIEGLCDIGNGNKTKDTKKIGYKGIGFKSVFMRSTCVTVKSGDYCFKFDKEYWDGYWDKHWKNEYGEKNKDKNYLMPWQIIPVETEEPIAIDSSRYNVVTFIKTANTSSLETKIIKLLSNSQFLLFLKCRNIQMTFGTHNNVFANVSKMCDGNFVILSSNGKEDSRWLTYTNPEVEVPKELYGDIRADINTPQKLKDSKTFDLSFAIRIDGSGKLKCLDKDEAVIYTYLPTSYKFADEGFPFLVNANFITDAGRQQLHKDSVWNKLIFSKIPFEYLNWMKKVSSEYNNYYEALPKVSYGCNNVLEEMYASAMEKAIKEVAFIPKASNPKSKVLASAAVMDKIGISEAISKEMLVAHINRTNDKNYSADNLINPIRKGSKLLEEYGVFVFDKQKLKSLFEDKDAFAAINAEFDVKLIDFLFEYYLRNQNEQEEFMSVLQSTAFLLDENGNLSTADKLFFPSQHKECNDFEEDALFLHSAINEHLKANRSEYEWIAKLGVDELSDIKFIEKVICKSGYITTENALAIGTYLFSVWEKQNFIEEISCYSLSKLRFITNEGTLKTVDDLYLGNKYYPILDLQSVCDSDIFVSDKYCESTSEITRRKWHNFFRDLNICDDICLREIKFYQNSEIYDLLKDYVSFAVNHEYNHSDWTGGNYYMSFSYINIKYVPYVSVKKTELKLSKLVWTYILSQSVELSRGNDYIFGPTGGGYYKSGYLCDKSPEHDYLGMNFLPWVIKFHQTFPASTGEMLMAKELYKNTPIVKELFGKYLPFIDVDCEIDSSWDDLLLLKMEPSLEDYLKLLSNIAKDENNADQNKERISKVYQRLVDLDVLSSDSKSEQVKEWSKSNKILSKDGTFKFPTELSHITLDGFKSENRVYVGTPTDRSKVIDLLSLMGVKVITEDSIKTTFISKTETKELQNLLLGKLSPLAIISSDDSSDKNCYREKKKELRDLLVNTYFYHCESIRLTYGNDNDTIEKNSFGNKNEFYYTGSLRPANVEPLLTPLCKYLNIKGKERELFVMLIEDFEGIRQNLEDKGYDISLLEQEQQIDSGTIQVKLGGYNPNSSQQERNKRTGFKGEILVYEKLTAMGYSPICKSIATEDDYEQLITLNDKTYYCKSNYDKYDISFVTKSGITVFLEVKATTCDKTSQDNMPISYRELSMLEECDTDDSCSYMMVRVFGIDKEKQDFYLFTGHLLKD